MADFFKILADLRASGASDVHAASDEPLYVRRVGRLEPLPDLKMAEADLKKIILATSSPKAREIFGKARQVNYAFEEPSAGRLRISAFFSRNKFAFSLRFLPSTPPKLADVGLPENIKKVLAKQSGLILVGSPSGQGKTWTIASLLDFINTHYEKNIITVENPVEIRFKDDHSSFIQRSIPLDVPNFVEGLTEAYRLDPDVVMTDSVNYKDAMDQALFLCEAGCLVIGACDGGNCQQILERIIYARDEKERDSIRGKLTTHLAMVISQRLAPTTEGKSMTPVFDIVVNVPSVKNLIKNDNLSMLRNLQEQDKTAGMVHFDGQLTELVKKNLITPATAISLAEDSQGMANRFPKAKG